MAYKVQEKFNLQLPIEVSSLTLPPHNQEEASEQQKGDTETLAEVIQPDDDVPQKANMPEEVC